MQTIHEPKLQRRTRYVFQIMFNTMMFFDTRQSIADFDIILRIAPHYI